MIALFLDTLEQQEGDRTEDVIALFLDTLEQQEGVALRM